MRVLINLFSFSLLASKHQSQINWLSLRCNLTAPSTVPSPHFIPLIAGSCKLALHSSHGGSSLLSNRLPLAMRHERHRDKAGESVPTICLQPQLHLQILCSFSYSLNRSIALSGVIWFF